MITANISTYNPIEIGNFNIPISLTEPISGFTISNFQKTALDGNGDTDISFDILGSGQNYNVAVNLPENQTGAFRLYLVGLVVAESTGENEIISSNKVTIQYNTKRYINVEIADPITQSDGCKKVLIHFQEKVMHITKWYFQLNGENIGNATYTLSGEGQDYQLIVKNATSNFSVSIVKPVVNADNLTLMPRII